MVDVVIAGSVAFDSIKTPFGHSEKTLGGSAVYASLAASFFSRPGMVSVVGKDFGKEHVDFLYEKGVDTDGLEQKDGKTFSWKGEYGLDINVAKTLEVDTKIWDSFKPSVPNEYKEAEFLFLGNIDPELQLHVLNQMKKTKLVIADTMNHWIENKKDKVLEIVKKADVCLMNDAEARQLFNTPNLVQAAQKMLEMESDLAIIKKGEHGALLTTKKGSFVAPAYPLASIVDPTGCGDSFAGAMIGFLAKQGNVDEDAMRKAIIYGSTVASFNAEGLGLERLKKLEKTEIEQRFNEFKEMVRF